MVQQIYRDLKNLTSYLNDYEKIKIENALRLSESVHSNQLRKSGDPFIIHPFVLLILSYQPAFFLWLYRRLI